MFLRFYFLIIIISFHLNFSNETTSITLFFFLFNALYASVSKQTKPAQTK